MITSLPISFSSIIHNFTNRKSLSVHHLGSKSSRYEQNTDRRAVNKLSPTLTQIIARLCVRLSVQGKPTASQDQQRLLQIQLLVKKWRLQ